MWEVELQCQVKSWVFHGFEKRLEELWPNGRVSLGFTGSLGS